MRTNRRSDYALAGMAFGMTQYFVDEGRLFYILLVVAWIGLGILIWRPRPSWRGLAITLAVALLVSVPYYYTIYGQGLSMFPRAETEGVSYWQRFVTEGQFELVLEEIKYNISTNFLLYLHNYDRPLLWLFYGGEQPLLLLWLVPFFLLGMGYALWRLRWPVGSLLVIWVISAPLGISMVSSPGATVRFTVVLPALMLAVALGLHYLYSLMTNIRYRPVMLGALVGLMTFGQFNYYFSEHLPRYNQQLRIWAVVTRWTRHFAPLTCRRVRACISSAAVSTATHGNSKRYCISYAMI